MAENLDNDKSFGNFSIENTMEMGMGNSELLNDLMSPETSTSSPDDIQDITEEPAPPKTKKTAKSIGETINEANVEKKDEVENDKKSLTDFLSDIEEEEEENEEVKPSTVIKSNSSTDESEEKEISRFSALSNDLYKLGVFSKDNDDEETLPINTPEEFLERFQEEKRKGAIDVVNTFISQFGEDYQQAFEAIYVKGVNPKEYFGAYNSITSFAELDLSNESNQIHVLKQALNDQGFEPEDVETEIERLKNYGDLETVAAKHHKVLIKKEAIKLQQIEQQSQQLLQQKQAIKSEYANNVNHILQEKLKTKEFDGIPINPKLINELQDFLITDKYKTSSGEQITEFDRTILELKRPENHEKKVKLGLLLKILEKDPTLSTIQKSGISKKSDILFSEVARQVTKEGTKSPSGSNKSNSWFL
jgi:hypothetical protein